MTTYTDAIASNNNFSLNLVNGAPVALMGLSGKSRDPTSGILHIVKDP